MATDGMIDDEYLQAQHENIYNSYDECNIELWYPKISTHTIPTHILQLTIEDIEAFVVYAQYFRNCLDDLEPDKFNIIERNFSVLNNNQRRWGETVSWLKLNIPTLNVYKRKLKMMQYKLNTYMSEFKSLKTSKAIAFIPKLSIDMQIPTDALYSSTRTYKCFENCLKNAGKKNKHRSSFLVRKYYEACWKAMEVENATEIIDLIIRSEFMLNALNTAHHKLSENKDKINCSLVLQTIPYQTAENILQFRMFISSQHPIAITQYQSFINYNQQTMKTFILPIQSAMITKWNQILSDEKSNDFEEKNTLQENIKNILIKQYEEIKCQLKFTKCNNYCIDFMIINTVEYEYDVYVVGINREPLYEYQYGLLDYFADVQAKHVGLMFGKNIPEVSIRLSIRGDHVDGLNVNEILPEYVVEYLCLHCWVKPYNIRQVYSLIVWRFALINKIISKTCHVIDKLVETLSKCWDYVHVVGGFGGTELFYMSCGGMITLWIEYIINNSSLIGVCLFFLEMILSDLILPVMLCLIGIWFVLGLILSLYFLFKL